RPVLNAAPLLLSVVAATIVVGAVWVDVQNPSPGELAAVHAQLAQLGGSEGCAACHTEFGSSMSDACFKCHADIKQQSDDAKGFHGLLSENSAEACEACHSEHHGVDFVPTNRRSFELAGVSDLDVFKHEGLNFALIGKHLELKCAECHRNADATSLLPKQKRYLGLDQACIACHKDVHQGGYGPQCASCHGQSKPFRQAATFQHS
ncbi:MAG: hypothetical protein KDA61_20510, partial [Planctomycetales bacterium]|nr:hypothetical protein [Planctomycetales bacterium]